MVVLRRTQKLAGSLPVSDQSAAASETALGDWYVNKHVVHRRPVLLLVSSHGLLPILTLARDVANLPKRLPHLVATRLERLAVASNLIEAELRVMAPVVVARTANRSILGVEVDLAKALPLLLEPNGWDESTLPFVESQLGETPCYAGHRVNEVVFPNRDVVHLLEERWAAG